MNQGRDFDEDGTFFNKQPDETTKVNHPKDSSAFKIHATDD